MRSKLAYFMILTAHHAVMSYEIIAGMSYEIINHSQ